MKFYDNIEEIRAEREVIREKIKGDVTAENMGEIIVEAMEHYVEAIMAVINPMQRIEIPFLIAALRQALEFLESDHKDTLPVAKVLGILVSAEHETITIKPNGEEEE